MSKKHKYLDEIPPLAEYQAQQADKEQREFYLKGSRERTSANRVTAPLSEGDREYYRVMSEMAASKMEDYVSQYANDNNMSLISAAIKLSKTKDEDNIEDPIIQNYINTRKQFIDLSTQYRTGKMYLDDCIATYTSNNPNPCHYSERTKEVADNPSKFGLKQVTRNEIRPGGLVLFTNRGVPYHAAALDTIINGKMKLNYSPGADRDYVRGGNEWDSPDSKLYYNFVGNSEDSLRWEKEYNEKYGIKKKLGGSCRRSLKDGGIYIKPSHRGRFTALKERTGHSATWFKENGTPAQKKMATFALNAAKWKH